MAKKFSGSEAGNVVEMPAAKASEAAQKDKAARKPAKAKGFDIEAATLPESIIDAAYHSGGYPYGKRMKRKRYSRELQPLQIELQKLMRWVQKEGERIVIVFEGRDGAGKGGTISRFTQHLNPRHARIVALSKPSDTETGQWYFQRYAAEMPTAGEMVFFDRSWYNRAGVEPVMGFCTPEQYERFLDETPHLERMISNDGVHFFKFWLNIGRETQLERFHDRRWSPLKNWKFSPIDIAGINKWDDYTKARDIMIERTHKEFAPWIVVRANDKRRARLAVLQRILLSLPYEGRDLDAIGKEDKKIIGEGPSFLEK